MGYPAAVVRARPTGRPSFFLFQPQMAHGPILNTEALRGGDPQARFRPARTRPLARDTASRPAAPIRRGRLARLFVRAPPVAAYSYARIPAVWPSRRWAIRIAAVHSLLNALPG